MMNFCGGTIEQQVHEQPEDVMVGLDCSNVSPTVSRLTQQPGKPQRMSGSSTTCYKADAAKSSLNGTRRNSHDNEKSSSKGMSTHSFAKLSKTRRPSQAATSTNDSVNPRSRSRSHSRRERPSLRTAAQQEQVKQQTEKQSRSIHQQFQKMQISSTAESRSDSYINLNTGNSTAATNSNNCPVASSKDRVGISSFSNMKTLETLLKRLESGFRVTIHNGVHPEGKRASLMLLQDRSSLVIRYSPQISLLRQHQDLQDNNDTSTTTTSIKFPVKAIFRLEIGKTSNNRNTKVSGSIRSSNQSVLNHPMYDHIHPMMCFSIVVKLSEQYPEETYFDFQANSGIEREALVSTLMVVLDRVHNNSGTAPSIVESSECSLSPRKTTKIHPLKEFYAQNEDQHVGTEISLVAGLPTRSKSSNKGRRVQSSQSTCKGNRPLRQRHLQPAVGTEDDDATIPNHHTFSSPLSSRRAPLSRGQRRHSGNEFKARSESSKNASSPSTPGTTVSSPIVVVDNEREHETEQRDNADDPGSIRILNSTHPNQPVTEIELCHDIDIPDDLSFEINHQGLPVSDKIHLSPTRENHRLHHRHRGGNSSDLQENNAICCNLASAADGVGPNPQQQAMAWCTDDICTLALKDFAETCTGIFDQPESAFPLNHVNICCTGNTEAERAQVQEYVTGVLGDATSATAGIGAFGNVWNASASKTATQNRKYAKVNRIQNRASVSNAQALRLQSLRNEMTFAAASKRLKEKMPYLQTTKSFDDAGNGRTRQEQERSSSMLQTPPALMERVMGSIAVLGEQPEADNDAVFYDSDPDDMRPRTRGGVRRACANRRNAVEEKKKHQIHRPVLSGVGFENITLSRRLRKLDEDLIIQLVQVSYRLFGGGLKKMSFS